MTSIHKNRGYRWLSSLHPPLTAGYTQMLIVGPSKWIQYSPKVILKPVANFGFPVNIGSASQLLNTSKFIHQKLSLFWSSPTLKGWGPSVWAQCVQSFPDHWYWMVKVICPPAQKCERLVMPRTLHSLLVAAQEGDPDRVRFLFPIWQHNHRERVNLLSMIVIITNIGPAIFKITKLYKPRKRWQQSLTLVRLESMLPMRARSLPYRFFSSMLEFWYQHLDT